MEKDKGSGISPFLPPTNPKPNHPLLTPFHITLFLIRLPLLLLTLILYLLLFSWLLPRNPPANAPRRFYLWTTLLTTCAILWRDLRIDGVRRGSLNSKTATSHLPRPGSSVVASNWTGPIDALYLACIFDPVFVKCWPGSKYVQKITLTYAIASALLPSAIPAEEGPPFFRSPAASEEASARAAGLTTLADLTAMYPHRTIAIFPECTPTNGRAILPLSRALAGAKHGTKIFPTALKYSPADLGTPVPGWRGCGRFLWALLGANGWHEGRVKIAEAVTVPGSLGQVVEEELEMNGDNVDNEEELQSKREQEITSEERALLENVGEALARVARVKRVSLGVREKREFVEMWRGRGRKSATTKARTKLR
ncbi:MAG: hypothetical protein M1831_002202 [Alyxoria varia]|nr:MAG: hypothetical protein M1831_002202 [Alyxoria varia]